MSEENETIVAHDGAYTQPPLSLVESQERANIDMLIATAKKYPRDIVRVKRNMEAMATLDQETAESCNYRLVRDGHSIEGPSVRMAEIAVACYQNLRTGARVLSNDGKVITGQSFCHDLENNTFIAWETARRITDKHGRTYTEDMQVTTGNAAAAIAFRNAVFKVIPGALVRSVADKARQVAVGDLKTLVERRTRALKRFASIGVREDRILAFLGKSSAEQIDIADVENLFGIFTAIKDQSTTIEEQFPPIPKVVAPNFTNSPAPAAAEPPKSPMPDTQDLGAEPAKRGPGRPRKTEFQSQQTRPPHENQQQAAGGSANPPAAAQEELPKQSAAPEPIFKSEVHAEVYKRLAEDQIPHDKFLIRLLGFGFVNCHPDDIKSGKFTVNDVAAEDLEITLKNWDQVVHIGDV